MEKKNNIDARELTTGLSLMALSAFGLFINRSYEIGAANRMGPGYMPMVVLILLAVLGLGLAVTSLNAGHAKLEALAWRELSLILAALVLFGVFLEHIGMALSVVVVVVLSALADREQTITGTAALTVFLVFFCWLVFSWGLAVSVPFLPPFLDFA